MRKKGTWITAMAIIILFAAPSLFAGGVQEAENAEEGAEETEEAENAQAAAGTEEAEGVQEAEDFSAKLEAALAKSDFSEEEARAVAESVRARIGDAGEGENESENADPEVVARALGLAKNENAELDAEQNAELALELAQNSVRLKEENYDKTVVAKATMNAVRDMLGQIKEWKSGDMSENLGEMVRSTVSTEARKAAQKQSSDKAASGKADTAAESGEKKASEAASSSNGGDKVDTSGADR